MIFGVCIASQNAPSSPSNVLIMLNNIIWNSFNFPPYFLQRHANSTLKMGSMAGKRLVQLSITSRHTVTTLQLGIGDNLPNSKGIGGLGVPKTDHQLCQRQDYCKETDHREPSLRLPLKLWAVSLHFLSVEAVI